MNETILKFDQVGKIFSGDDSIDFKALSSINLEVKRGEFIGLSGKSGSGKTTLLNIAGLIDSPTSGNLFLKNTNTKLLSDNQLSEIRSKEIGYIFQTFNLLPLLSALENVEYPLMLLNIPEHERIMLAKDALIRVGLEKFMNYKPSQLSGGQRQRVAFARAIVKKPSIILADEPTANLDTKTSEEIFDLLLRLQKELNITIILCSHDQDLISKTHRHIKISDGVIENQTGVNL